MAQRSAKEMSTPRVVPVGSHSDQKPVVNNQTAASSGARVPVAIPSGGEMHVRSLKGGGVLASVRDSNYNTVSETYAEDPTAIDISTSGV